MYFFRYLVGWEIVLISYLSSLQYLVFVPVLVLELFKSMQVPYF